MDRQNRRWFVFPNAARSQISGIGINTSAAQGEPADGLLLVFLFPGALGGDALLGQDLLFRLFLTVNFLLPLRFFPVAGKGLELIGAPVSREPRQKHRPVPGTEPLLNVDSAQDLTGPGGMVQAKGTGTQILK